MWTSTQKSRKKFIIFVSNNKFIKKYVFIKKNIF